MVLKKLDDELLGEFVRALSLLALNEKMKVIVEPHEHEKLVRSCIHPLSYEKEIITSYECPALSWCSYITLYGRQRWALTTWIPTMSQRRTGGLMLAVFASLLLLHANIAGSHSIA